MKKLTLVAALLGASLLMIGCTGVEKNTTNVTNQTTQTQDENKTVNGFTVVQDSVMFAKFSKTIDELNKVACTQIFGKNDAVELDSFEGFLLINGDIADNAVPRTNGHGGVAGVTFGFILTEAQMKNKIACASEYYENDEHLRIRSRDYQIVDDKVVKTDPVETTDSTADDNSTADTNSTN